MIDFLSLMYDLYNYYIFMFVFFMCAIIGYSKKKQAFSNSTVKKAIQIFGIFMLGLGCSVIIWWIPTSLVSELIRVLLGIILSIFLGLNSSIMMDKLIRIAKKIVSTKAAQRLKYGVPIFMIWMLQFVSQLPENLVDWVQCWYATDYSMGIGSRFLVGSVISLFYDEFMDVKIAYLFCNAFVVLLIAVCSYMLGCLINKSKHMAAIAFLIACFWACPTSIASYWTPENLGRLEFYALFVTLVSVCLFLSSKKRWVKYGILCLGVVVCNAIYQGYVFLYFPIVFIVLVCEAYKTGYKKEELIGGMLVLASVCGSFLFFQFGSYIIYGTQAEFEAAIQAKSNVYICNPAIRYELFMSISEVYKEVNIPFIFSDRYVREMSVITVAIFAPIVVVGIAMYLKCFEKFGEKGQNIFKNPYFWCVLCQLAILPQFVLNIDWGRWFIAIVIVFFFGIFYMLYVEMEETMIAAAALEKFVKKHYFVAVTIVLYLALFQKMTDMGMRTQIVFMIRNLGRLIGIV